MKAAKKNRVNLRNRWITGRTSPKLSEIGPTSSNTRQKDANECFDDVVRRRNGRRSECRDTGAWPEPGLGRGLMSELGELDLSGITAAEERQILDRLLGGDFDQWAELAARVGHCAHPIRLTGQQHTVQAATGSILSTFASASLPDKVLYVRCNNRRASCCPSCSRTYRTLSGSDAESKVDRIDPVAAWTVCCWPVSRIGWAQCPTRAACSAELPTRGTSVVWPR